MNPNSPPPAWLPKSIPMGPPPTPPPPAGKPPKPPSGKSPITSATNRKTSSFSLTKFVQKGLWVSAICVGGMVCFWNAQPYIRLIQMGQARAFEMGMMVPQGARIAMICGGLTWALVQFGEVLYVVLMHDRQAIRDLLANRKTDTLGIAPDDDDEAVELKEAYNRVGAGSVRNARRGMWFAYTVDLLMCVTVYPPADSFERFFWAILTFRLGDLNWPNIGMLLAMMFVFEFMLRIVLYLNRQQTMLSRRKGA